MHLFRIVLTLLLSFSSLKAQNYKELLAKATHTKSDSIKLIYLFDAATRVNNISEFHAVLPDIFSLITKKYIDPSPFYLKGVQTARYKYDKLSYIPPLHFINFSKKRFFSFKTYKKLKENAPIDIANSFLTILGLSKAYENKVAQTKKIATLLTEQGAKKTSPHLILGQLYFYNSRKSEQGYNSYLKVLELDASYAPISKKIAVKLAMESAWMSMSEYTTEYIMLPTPSYYKDYDSLRVQTNLNQAVIHIDNALKLDASNSNYLKLKGDFLFATLKEDEALNNYFKAIQIDSNYAAIKRVVSMYKKNGAYQKGIDLYTKYMLPYHVFEIKLGRAYLYYLQKNYTKSLEDLNSIESTNQYNEELLLTHRYLKGANYARSKEYLKAMECLQDLDAPYYWGSLCEEFYFALALVYSKQGDVPKKKVLQLLDIALLYDNNNPEYLALKAKMEQMD